MHNPKSDPRHYANWYLRHVTLKLDGQSRMRLVREQDAGDLSRPGHQSLQVPFHDNEKRMEIRRITKEAFGLSFVVDPTNLGKFRIRLSSRPPDSELEERGIHAAAIAFHNEAQLIDDASDGIKAFTGILTEVIAGDPKILLIDEPEAFLHPALAHKLGNELARAAAGSDKRLFISTHSPSFVMGCIQSGSPVNIVRFTYRNRAATARILPSEDILSLMRNPLLRSTGVLGALFYESVIVTESDTDRAFYEEINERLLRYKPEWGTPNCLFLNAQNKQTVQTIIRPLRQLGIPAAAIVDVDVLKEGGKPWKALIDAVGVPELSQGALSTHRAAILRALDASGKDMKRDGGISILEGTEKESAESLLATLAEHGLFVVPGGELESWLKNLGVTGHGPNWLIAAFEAMGEDATSSSYVMPTESDVWRFMAGLRKWLLLPTRRGIPS
jgi:hypothetical protein